MTRQKPQRLRITGNHYTMARLLATPIVAILVFIPGARLVAVIVFALAALTDLFDGLVARRQGATSQYGAWLDSLADKLLVLCTLTVLLGTGEIAAWNALAVAIIIFRETGVTGLRTYLAMIEASEHHQGNTQQPLPSSKLAKIKAALQFIATALILFAPLTGTATDIVRNFGLALLWISAIVALQSGYQYFSHAKDKIRQAKST
ncbi:MAG: CDP-alcohol phosphatidyltransferase family protein [Alphaproteobacteria bacterium]